MFAIEEHDQLLSNDSGQDDNVVVAQPDTTSSDASAAGSVDARVDAPLEAVNDDVAIQLRLHHFIRASKGMNKQVTASMLDFYHRFRATSR